MWLWVATYRHLIRYTACSRLRPRFVHCVSLYFYVDCDIKTGGPGGGTDSSDRTFFNPDKYKVGYLLRMLPL